MLGAIFLGLELSEFAGLIARGAGPSRSAFLSAFFSLVGLHGAHVTAGLLWLAFMVAQTAVRGPQGLRAPPAALLQSFLARARYHLGGAADLGLPDGSTMMQEHAARPATADRAPGADEGSQPGSILTYTVGLVFALLLTGASFIVSQTHLLWAPGVPAGLAVLAIAQMGVHLVFFLHISTGADNTNNVRRARLRHFDRDARRLGDALDHGAPQRQHDAALRDHGDAPVKRKTVQSTGLRPHFAVELTRSLSEYFPTGW